MYAWDHFENDQAFTTFVLNLFITPAAYESPLI